ncbi:shikimate kinase [Anaerobium acetethylicum]|uniref:Shikimate kinase n=1 Tax=Anaerobium acetethylicum TaxID=1619234 RepID=A0A1D3TVB0_9FIRM|nr:shikimate kinase [Anaerobium acetethylicum]SCP98078.1 shikimate kinase [Anaerobium acetethylicum]
MNNIILIGFMGSGKTSVGEKLADQLGIRFVDTDEVIEKKYERSISSIFAEHGEPYFRLLETAVLEELSGDSEPFVMSAGGGLPVQDKNHEYLKKIGTTVYLKAKKETLVERLEGDRTRPLLQGGALEERIEALMKEREHIYEAVADLSVETDGRETEKIAEEIIARAVQRP